MRTTFAIMIACLAAGCAAQKPPAGASQSTSYEADGNLHSSNSVACVDVTEVTNRHTPADIFPGVRKCIDAGEYEKAGDLFLVAGTYGRFDMLRVADRTAHQAIMVLQLDHIGSAEEASVDSFQEAMKGRYDEGTDDLKRICENVKRMGPPNYYPTYMLQHGMSAFTGAGGGIKSSFNEAEAWSASLDSYLHCRI